MSDKKEQEGILDVFSWMGTKIKRLFVSAEPVLVATIKRFFAEFEADAISAVQAEAAKVLSGKEKFSNAVANIKALVESKGWTVSLTIVETLVQDAYTAWQASQTPVPGQLLVKAPQ